jgi:hypothetical protein
MPTFNNKSVQGIIDIIHAELTCFGTVSDKSIQGIINIASAQGITITDHSVQGIIDALASASCAPTEPDIPIVSLFTGGNGGYDFTNTIVLGGQEVLAQNGTYGGGGGGIVGHGSSGSFKAGNGGNGYAILTWLAGGPGESAVYTSPGTYSWTAPAGVTSVYVTGAGGGGGGSAGIVYGGAGGGGGEFIVNSLQTVSPGQAYAIIIGSGGVGPTINNDFYGEAGGDGETTKILNSAIILNGGKGGHDPDEAATTNIVLGGAGGAGGSGISGGAGGKCTYTPGSADDGQATAYSLGGVAVSNPAFGGAVSTSAGGGGASGPRY